MKFKEGLVEWFSQERAFRYFMQKWFDKLYYPQRLEELQFDLAQREGRA